MSQNQKFIITLLLIALAGIASLYLVPLETLVPEGEIDLPPHLLKLVLLIQPAVLSLIAILIGVFLSSKVGLSAPVLETLSKGMPLGSKLKQQLIPATIGGIGVAFILLAYGYITEAFFINSGSDILSKVLALNPPLLTKVLYGGMVEEILMRWGFMTLIIWGLWKLSEGHNPPTTVIIWTGICLSAFLFALGHFPVLYGITDNPPLWIMGSVLIGNALPGIWFGWLYYKFGLEAAMIAHALGHVFSTVIISFLN